MSPLISTEWDLIIIGVALGTLAMGFLFSWALCRAAAMADHAMERKVREDLLRSGS